MICSSMHRRHRNCYDLSTVKSLLKRKKSGIAIEKLSCRGSFDCICKIVSCEAALKDYVVY